MGPMAIPSPVVADQIPMARPRSSGARNTSLMTARVAGMMQAAPRPAIARAPIRVSTDPEKADPAEPAPKIDEPGDEEPLAAHPVPDAAGDEEHAGEDDGVGVDDPLELGRRGLQVAHEGREGDVEDRVVEGHHEERDAQDPEDQPTPAGRRRTGRLGLPGRRQCRHTPIRTRR